VGREFVSRYRMTPQKRWMLRRLVYARREGLVRLAAYLKIASHHELETVSTERIERVVSMTLMRLG
jgi:hypothetical protein